METKSKEKNISVLACVHTKNNNCTVTQENPRNLEKDVYLSASINCTVTAENLLESVTLHLQWDSD